MIKLDVVSLVSSIFWFFLWWIVHILGTIISQNSKLTIFVGCIVYTLSFSLMAYLFLKKAKNYYNDGTYMGFSRQQAKVQIYSICAMLISFLLLISLSYLGYIDYDFKK